MAVVAETATKPSCFAHCWQGAESLVPATQNNIRTSKSAPNPSAFSTFDFEMCFAPQRRALFQKWSEPVSLLHFWLPNALCATTACTFRHILTRKCASRHKVQFFISHLARCLRTRRFSEPTFFSTLRSHKSLEKHSESWLFYRFARSTMHLRRNSADLLRRNCSPTFLPITCAETSVKPNELPANYVQSGPKNDTMGHLTIDLPNSSSL